MTRLLAPHRLVSCASPAYLERYGIPQHVDELGRHSCFAFVHGGRPVEWRFAIDGQVRSIPISGRFSATNAEALRDATLAGIKEQQDRQPGLNTIPKGPRRSSQGSGLLKNRALRMAEVTRSNSKAPRQGRRRSDMVVSAAQAHVPTDAAE
jgi:DNA-binding transcriptional LysR family regulator